MLHHDASSGLAGMLGAIDGTHQLAFQTSLVRHPFLVCSVLMPSAPSTSHCDDRGSGGCRRGDRRESSELGVAEF